MDIKEFLTFRRMITPVIIQILFWIGAVMSVIMGLINMFGGGVRTLMGLLMIVLGPIAVRVYCELLILMFRMNETLTDIRKNTEKPGTPQ